MRLRLTFDLAATDHGGWGTNGQGGAFSRRVSCYSWRAIRRERQLMLRRTKWVPTPMLEPMKPMRRRASRLATLPLATVRRVVSH